MEGNFNERLIKAMSQMVNPSKSSTAVVPTKNGGKYTYKYETLDQVLAAVRPPLYENGIGLTQKLIKDTDGNGYVLQTIVFDGSDRAILDERPVIFTQDAQECGSYETYMRRYALRTAFGLAGEDDDGAATKKAPPSPAPAKPRPSKRQQMLAKIAKYKTVCIQHGMASEELDGYLEAFYQTSDVTKLTDDQLIEYGKQLAETVKRYEEEK